jgi:hypothetical protein
VDDQDGAARRRHEELGVLKDKPQVSTPAGAMQQGEVAPITIVIVASPRGLD